MCRGKRSQLHPQDLAEQERTGECGLQEQASPQ